MVTYILTDKILTQMESECLTQTDSLLQGSQLLTDVMEKVIKDCRLVIANIMALTDLRDAEDVLNAMQDLRALIKSKRAILQSMIFHKDFDATQIKTVGVPVFMMNQFLKNTKNGTETTDPVLDIVEAFENILLVDLKKSEVAESRCVKYLQDYLRNVTPAKVTRNSAFGNSVRLSYQFNLFLRNNDCNDFLQYASGSLVSHRIFKNIREGIKGILKLKI